MKTEILNESIINYVKSNPWLILLLIWTLAWKGWALWKASKNNHLPVFIVFLVLNTMGIAEIIYIAYLYYISKKQTVPQKTSDK